jgi:hypothetical protein
MAMTMLAGLIALAGFLYAADQAWVAATLAVLVFGGISVFNSYRRLD